MNKTIFILWFQGFENAPEVVKTCLKSWKRYNKNWNIIELTNDNLDKYVKLEDLIKNFEDKEISLAHKADLVRLYLLKNFSGIWVDATLYCNRPLDDWIFNYLDSGFFAFDKPRGDRLLSIWFMYSEKDNYLITTWLNKIIKYFEKNNKVSSYFMFQYFFNDLYYNDKKLKKIWDKTKKISSIGPHFLDVKGLHRKKNQEVVDHIQTKKSHVYKLTYKLKNPNFKNSSIIAFLIHKEKYKI